MKKIIFSFVLLCGISCTVHGQNTFPTAAGQNAGIGTTSPSTHTNYSGLTTNNATNGGFIDFLQNGSLRGYIFGDGTGLNLYSPGNYSLHLWANGTEDLTVIPNNNIGIGTVTPRSRLEVAPPFTTTPAAIMRLNGGQVWGHVLTLETDNVYGQDDPTMLFSYRNGSKQWAIGGSNGSLTGYTARFSIWEDATDGVFGSTNTVNNGYGTGNGYGNERFTIAPGGNVGIGQNNPANKLDVNGTVHSKSILVDMNGWSDYVFDTNYKLRSLQQVQIYIDKYHHLPGIPSKTDVIKNGLDVGDMNKILTKKVEELTLYEIEKDKQLANQQKQIDELRIQLNNLIKRSN